MAARRHPELLRLARFVLVGLTNTIVALVVYALLIGTGMAPVLASAVAFCAGAVNGYILNRSWTFDGAPGGAGVGARYVTVQLGGLALNAAGVSIAVSHLGLAPTAGEVVILPAVTASTFLLSRGWVFRAPRSG
jgi:putative flippase GtrA